MRRRREIGMLVAEPQDLRGDVTGINVQPGDSKDVRRVKPLAEHPCLARRAPIHPDDRRRQRSEIGVNRHESVYLGRKAERPHRRAVDSTPLEKPCDHVLQRRLPVARILLGPARPRVRDRIGLRCFGDGASIVVKQDALEALGTDVTTDDVNGTGLRKSSVVR